MSPELPPLHFVCTWDDAAALIARESALWVSDCGCRTARGGCARSRVDLCLQFRSSTAADPKGIREVTRTEALAILAEARSKDLVARPFRDDTTRTVIEGICFCCDDCCGYFLDRTERCDKGTRIERTDHTLCNDCLGCADHCHFGARVVAGDRVRIDSEICYGCGLCAEACSLGAIEMVQRPRGQTQ